MTTNDHMTAAALQQIGDIMFGSLDAIIPTHINREMPSEWAERKRIIPDGLSPYPGPFNWTFFPYMREIIDCLAESDPTRELAVMKGTQISATVGLGENWLGFIIDSAPAPTLYVTGDAQMAETQMELRIDAMINSAGIGHKIFSQHKRVSQRKSGDVKSRKEFPGGFLIAAGPNSGPKLRSMSFKNIYADEIDAWKQAVGKEGDVIELIRRRVDAFSEMYKVLWTSTPLIKSSSHIDRLFYEGDQRRYFVPCKHCGAMQYLKWSQIKFDLDDTESLVSGSTRYECEACGKTWVNDDKDWFLPRGEWRPTTEARRLNMRSYHVPGLLAPVGFRPWESAVFQFTELKRQNDMTKLQNWINTFLGEPWVEEHEKPKIEAILTRDRRYHVGELPPDAKPIFCTIGADVQGDRIECEVVAWGRDKESWSIDYHVFPGDTNDLESEAWQGLRQTIEEQHASLNVNLTGVDAGHRTDTVYEFADSFEQGVHPVMGSAVLTQDRQYIRLMPVTGRQTGRIDINTTILKQEIYRYLNREWIEGKNTRAGYCHFPADYKRNHYLQLTAEVPKPDRNGRMIFDSEGRRNERLDCRVYALACLYALKVVYEESIGDTMTWGDFWDYTGGAEGE